MSDLKKVVKANEGYDIKQLMIGAEGTLGIITKVVLNLLPAKMASSTALLCCTDAKSAAQLFQQLRANMAFELHSAEIMWPHYAKTTSQALNLTRLEHFINNNEGVYVLIELSNEANKDSMDILESALAELLETALISDALIAKSAGDAKDFWAIREESFLCDQIYPHGLWFDVSVPLGHLDDYSENLFKKIADISAELNVFLFGHLGDGNLHLTVSSGRPCPELHSDITMAVYEGLDQIGGSFSAEHGIGKDKITALASYTNAGKLELMHAIKKVIDPKGIMNPGKVLNR